MIHISRVSLKNFKSFKKVSLPIPRGFTAIVGPNGSGKSNVVDGICFVLGRSSAKSLRAERFSDLIFNGGKGAKPAGEAEVALYVDNSGREIPVEEKEIKISRTIDTTGNSVYRLNDRRTTRNEILDVLSAAKIQPDGHNIVLQGDITRIIEMNPIERRSIIDEIAGIAEYDERKRKALRELEKVSENVARAEAVLKEVQDQLAKLEKEKNDALRHEFLKGEIRKNRGIVLYSQHAAAKSALEKIEQEIAAQETKAQRISRYLNLLAVKLEAKKQEMEKANLDIVAKEQTEAVEVFKEMERAKNEISNQDEKISAAKSELSGALQSFSYIKAEMRNSYSELRQSKQESESLLEEIASIEEKIAAVKAKITDAYDKISRADEVALELREKLTRAHAKLEEERGKLAEAEKEKALLEERKSHRVSLLSELQKELQENKLKLSEAANAIEANTNKKRKLEEEIHKKSLRKRELIENSTELRKEIEKINAVLQVKSEQMGKLEAKCKAIEEISRKRVSLNDAVDAILRLRNTEKGIFGTIAELGKANQKYSKALEIAAGAALQFIVVEDDGVAERCINYLKENKIGRATFLPLSRLRTHEPSQEAKEIANRAHGFAIDLVEFDKKFYPAFAQVYRDTVVVEDIAFARRSIGRMRMVTLDGDLIETSGSMSGGFTKPSALGFEDASRKELEALQKEVQKLSKERESLAEQESKALKEIEEINTFEVEAAKEKEAASEKARMAIEVREEILKLAGEKELQLREASTGLKDLESKIAQVSASASSLAKAAAELHNQKSALELELQESSAEKILRDIKELESRAAALEKSRDEKNSQIKFNDSLAGEILKPKIFKLKEELLRCFSSKKNLNLQIGALEARKKEAETALAVLSKKNEAVQGEIKKLKARRDFLVRAVKKIDRKLGELRSEQDEIAKKLEYSRIEKARIETRLEDLSTSLKQFADMSFEIAEPIDTKELEVLVARMEAEMQSLEPINMRAVEDYEAVRAKYMGLSGKVERLLAEKQAIQNLMDEIEHRKKAIFMEVFEHVARNFRHIFERLSEGGSAELILDEEHPLDGGLQIQAKPPGKNPQYIDLLSGGERTLTALSFIFAIQSYQPAPFYVLDEIDMFLDDDNVKKISELIKESSKEAQFIVVSLRDNMMSAADQLFGVSNEDGVSKIVGVELEEVGRA